MHNDTVRTKAEKQMKERDKRLEKRSAAREKKIQEIVISLADSLGEGTEALSLRTGLHSGSGKICCFGVVFVCIVINPYPTALCPQSLLEC